MADTGWLDCSSAAEDTSSGTHTFANATNVYSANSTYASAGSAKTPGGAYSTHLLACKGFGASVPSGATINGVEFRVKHYGTGATLATWGLAKIIKADGTYGSTDKGPNSNLPASNSYETVGGAADLWSETLAVADVNDADFGVVLQYDCPNAPFYCYVDHVQCKVTYTEAAPPSGPAPAQAVMCVC